MSSFKFPILNNKSWLEEQYLIKLLSARAIGRMIGTSDGVIKQALDRHSITVRTNKKGKYQYLYGNLNNKEWLYEQYITKQLSTKDISKLVGAKTSNSVRQALIRSDIEIRERRDSLNLIRKEDYFVLNNINQQLIEGSLLGDGSLTVYNIQSDESYPYFKKKNKYFDHILYVASHLFTQNAELQIKSQFDPRFKLTYYQVQTSSHLELLPFLRLWYPEYNNYKKIIPESLDVTPLIMLNWFMDDGHAQIRKRDKEHKEYKEGDKRFRKIHKKQIKLVMCTECFTRDNQEMLAEKIKNKFNLKFSTTCCNFGTGWRLLLPQSQTNNFYEIIGECPVKSLKYKWK